MRPFTAIFARYGMLCPFQLTEYLADVLDTLSRLRNSIRWSLLKEPIAQRTGNQPIQGSHLYAIGYGRK